MINVDYTNGKLSVSFGDEQAAVDIDTAIYPKSEYIKVILERMDFSNENKKLANITRAKEMVWYLFEILRAHLNKLGNRHPDYSVLEKEHQTLTTMNNLLYLGIQCISGSTHAMMMEIKNPIIQYN